MLRITSIQLWRTFGIFTQYFCLYSTFCHGVIAQDTVYDEKELIGSLLLNYDPRARPVLDSAQPVRVRFGITPIQIFDMDEVNQVLTLNVWLQYIWTDERLTWHPVKYNSLMKLRLPESAIWLPDIVLYNSAEEYKETLKTRVQVDNNGTVFWGPPTRFRASCKFDVAYFPFDVQVCYLKFSSWMYDIHQLQLTDLEGPVDLSQYIESGEWDLMSINKTSNQVQYECCPNPFPFVTYQLVMKRRVLYYMFNIIFPCLWLAILSVMTFWLPPDSGEKITLGITVLLAFSVFMLLVAESMPKTSESVPLIGIYLSVNMGLTSMSILLTIIILQIHHVGPRQRMMPPWLKRFAFDHLARVLCVRNTVHNFVKDEREERKFLYPEPTANQINNRKTFSTKYVMELVHKINPETSPTRVKAKLHHPGNGLNNNVNNSSSTNPAVARLEAALAELQRNASEHKDEKIQQQEQELIGDEWRLLAIILDRLFFWIYMLITLATSVGILAVMPTTGSEPTMV